MKPASGQEDGAGERPAGDKRVGLWLNGVRGSVATTACVGLLALRRGLVPSIGCVTDRPPLADAALPAWGDFVVGGHDVVQTPWWKKAESLSHAGVIPPEVFQAVGEDLRALEEELRPGYDSTVEDAPQLAAAERLSADLLDFKTRHGLDRVVVVNVSSTEAPFAPGTESDGLRTLRSAMSAPGACVLPPSSVAAYAAFSAGCAFVDFTPSTGARLPALHELALEQGVPYAGSDGKTGETLLRTVLAPMFAARALNVLSWAGVNLLGGGDGATLSDTAVVESKLASKSGVLPALLGTDVTAPLHIDNVPDLGDRKTAWDHVHFEGFLGVRMSMQITWAGVDSALAAPLVLDLARLVSAAQTAGLAGPLPELGFFFKDPLGTGGHDFAEQTRVLTRWALRL